MFDAYKQNEIKITCADDLFLHFLPDFSVHTPLHYLVEEENVEKLNFIVNQITQDMFEEFLNNADYINKLKTFLDYLYEYEYHFSHDLILLIYARIDDLLSLQIVDEEEDEKDFTEYERNVLKFQKFLQRILIKIYGEYTSNMRKLWRIQAF